MEKQSVTIEKANDLIIIKHGTLNQKLSIMPVLKVYELDDNSVLIFRGYSQQPMIYYDKEKILAELEQRRPRAPFENFQQELSTFPANKEQLLSLLSEKLQIKIEIGNLNKDYLDYVTKAVKKFGLKKAQDSLLLSLTVFVGDNVILKKGGHWKSEDVTFPNSQKQPYIEDKKGKKNELFVKFLLDSLDGKKKFDLYSLLIFETTDRDNPTVN